jgi:phage head-tail adaptor, putative, SPP1 family
MKAGSLNRRVTLQSFVSVADEFGQEVKEWKDFATVWAHIWAGNGKEFITSGKETSSLSESVRIRYRTDVKADMRVLRDGVPMNIVAVVPDRVNREYVDLICESGVKYGASD